VSAVLCPRCETSFYTPYGESWEPGDPLPPALSRLTREENDTPIYVCSACGQDEAMLEFFGPGAQPPETWPVETTYILPKPSDQKE